MQQASLHPPRTRVCRRSLVWVGTRVGDPIPFTTHARGKAHRKGGGGPPAARFATSGPSVQLPGPLLAAVHFFLRGCLAEHPPGPHPAHHECAAQNRDEQPRRMVRVHRPQYLGATPLHRARTLADPNRRVPRPTTCSTPRPDPSIGSHSRRTSVKVSLEIFPASPVCQAYALCLNCTESLNSIIGGSSRRG